MQKEHERGKERDQNTPKRPSPSGQGGLRETDARSALERRETRHTPPCSLSVGGGGRRKATMKKAETALHANFLKIFRFFLFLFFLPRFSFPSPLASPLLPC